MKKWISWVALGCVILVLCQSIGGQGVSIWTEKGCNASYRPGETVKIHYRVSGTGWTKVFKQYPDTHEEEIEGWKYFHTGGESYILDTVGSECGTIMYTVIFYQEVTPVEGWACYGCGGGVVYVMETGRAMCSIKVLCDMRTSLFTDKSEYVAGVDSEAKITLNITDVYESPLDADSVVLDVNGQGVTPVKSSPGVYTGLYTLTGREPGEYTVTANVFKRDYPQAVETCTFSLIVPVTVYLSTDSAVYAQGSEAFVRAEVQDVSGRGVNGLQFGLEVSGVTVPFTDMGGGIYTAVLDLQGFNKGQYQTDITSFSRYIQVDSIKRAEFTVGGIPVIVVDAPEGVEVGVNNTEEVSVIVRNTGDGDASSLYVSAGVSPGVDITGVSGYGPVLAAGDQTTAIISITGREKGEYTVLVNVSYMDVGGNEKTASGSIPVTVSSAIGLLVIAGLGAAVAVGAGAFAIKGKMGAKAAEEISKKTGQKITSEASKHVGSNVASEASKHVGSNVASEASKQAGAHIASEASKQAGAHIASEASKQAGSKVAGGLATGAVGGVVKSKSHTCPECGVENPLDSKFCSQCGAEL
ncbi:MAG: zinc-ribbon domain-containing protein [Candidatus Methanofastidiosia archaeon]|jgi:hypothetical protein